MPLATATITFDLADMLGVDFDSRRTKVWVDTNVPNDTVIDTDGNQIRLGSGNVTIATDGTGSFTTWVPGTGSNPASWQTYVHIDYPDRNQGGRSQRTFGPFTITASANLADMVAQAEVPPTAVTGDSAVAAFVNSPTSETSAALSATYAGLGSGNIQATARKMADEFGDVTMLLLGDSITVIYYPKLLDQLKVMYPHRSIRTYSWNDTTKVYGSAVTYFTGSGLTWLNVYDGSKGGTVAEFAYLDYSVKVSPVQPDLTVIAYGLNHGATATAIARLAYRQELQRLSSVVKATCPTTDLMLIGQNPRIDVGYETDLATNRAQHVRSVAAEMGAAYGPVAEAFAASPATYLQADGVHPNTAGAALYGTVLEPLFRVHDEIQPSARVTSPLLSPGSEVGVNGDFAAFSGAVPTGWTAVNATCSKDTTNYESLNGYAVKINASASAQSRITQNVPINRVRGKWLTVAARMWIPAGQSNITGRTEIATTGGAAPVAQSPGTQATTRDCWTWEYISMFIPEDATTCTIKVIAGATTDPTAEVTVDRVFIGIGTQPHDVISRAPLPQLDLPVAQDGLTAGQMVPTRDLMQVNSVSHATGTLGLAFFTADKTETINSLTAYTGSTAAAATPTLIRMGIYEIDVSGNGTLVASTANDTTLFATANAAHLKALSAPFNKVAGQRYATAILIVSGVGLPTFMGPLAVSNPSAQIAADLAPRTISRITAQTDLPASFTPVGLAVYSQRTHILLKL